MLKRFKIRSRAESVFLPMWNALEQRITTRQRIWADYLNRKAGQMTPFRKWLLFIAICGCFGSASTYCIVKAFSAKTPPVKVDTIAVPAHALPHVSHSSDAKGLFTDAELKHLQTIVWYVDSLQACGSPIYDSLVSRNPHFPGDISELKQVLKSYKHQ